MVDTYVAQLTVDELQALIRRTVQEAVTEVLIEFLATAEYEAELSARAEMTDFLRTVLVERPGHMSPHEAELDD